MMMLFRKSYILCLCLLFLFCFQPVYSKKKSDLEIQITRKPDDCFEVAEEGDEVSVHYTGMFEDEATIFDSSRRAGREPLSFKLGEKRVIQGWEQGILGMCVGETRKLIIPPHLAYGKTGHPPAIPGDATLIFQTELMGLKKKTIEQNFLKLAQFVSVPLVIIFTIYYLYQKVSQSPGKKELKQEQKNKKKRR